MAERTCSIDGCTRKHLARGMCSSHYGTWHREVNGRKRNDERFPITCIVCGAAHQSSRREGRFCSDACKGQHYSETKRTRCKLPADHPVVLQIAANKAAERAARELAKVGQFAWRTERECPGCACWFTPLYTSITVCCSHRCSKKMARRRRRAREHNTLNDWRWSDFMRIAQRFDFRCAYCGCKPGQLEPDHVVPLSRGGADAVSNLLPSCRDCNADKNAHLLDEWAAWRVERGKEARVTSWSATDRRFTHLALISPAA